MQWYHRTSDREDSFIWLSLQHEAASNIAHEYQQMVLADEEEAKFSFYAKMVFFQQDIAHVPQSSYRKRNAYCKMEWAAAPDGLTLRCPPIVRYARLSSERELAEAPSALPASLIVPFGYPRSSLILDIAA